MALSLALHLPLTPSAASPLKCVDSAAFSFHSCVCFVPRFCSNGSAEVMGSFSGVKCVGSSWSVQRTAQRGRGRVVCALADGSADEAPESSGESTESNGESTASKGEATASNGEASASNGGTPPLDGVSGAIDKNYKSRRDMLQEYVKNVQPDFMERFVQKAPSQVVEAMRQTVTNMLGTLPPQFFDINVSTVAENLAQLMYSVMMTGYMFRNAQYRLELQTSLSQAALPVPSNGASDVIYAPGTQKTRVSGEVVRWREDEGPESMNAVEYIELLEAEVEELKKQLEQRGRGRNDLLEYLKSLQPQNLQELTTSAGEDALEAMNTFVARLIGVADPTQLKRAATQTTAAELARILYWLMVVGYSIRNIEVRYDMERVLGMPAKLAELPPGEPK